MINRKIAMSAMSILTALSLTGATAFAAFTSQAQSVGNSFASGNADLQVGADTGSEGTVIFASSFAAPDYTNLSPGFTGNTDFWIKNNSSSAISLDVVADLANLSETGPELKDNLMISWTCDTDDNGSIGDNTPTSEFSVNGWITGGNTALGTLAQGNAIFCRMHAQVPGTAGNDIQGDSLSFDVLYDATQTP